MTAITIAVMVMEDPGVVMAVTQAVDGDRVMVGDLVTAGVAIRVVGVAIQATAMVTARRPGNNRRRLRKSPNKESTFRCP